ncbi:MAG: hypothetical protein PVJ27_00280 [Candidatus Brocadiaceae bacterium]|jgi:hypothetical protein
MRAWSRALLVVLAVVLAAVLPVVALAGGPRHEREGERVEARRHAAAMQREAEHLRERVEVLIRAAAAVEEHGMPEMAEMLRRRAEETEREFHALKERAAERLEAPPPPAMMHMQEMARRHTEMLEHLAAGQEKLHGRVRELTEQVHALRKELRAFREDLKAARR